MEKNTKNAYELIKMMFCDENLAYYVINNWYAVYEGLKKGELKEYDAYCKIIIDDWKVDKFINKIEMLGSPEPFKLKK